MIFNRRQPMSHLEWYRLSKPLFKELDVAGTNSPLLLVNVPPLPAWSDDQPWPEGCTLFIPFQDPENVGAVDPLGRGIWGRPSRPAQGMPHTPFIPRVAARLAPRSFKFPCLKDRRSTSLVRGTSP